MLQVIISPAKQMRAAQDAFEVPGHPTLCARDGSLHRALLDIERNEGSGGLQALWNVSDKLLGPCLNTLHEFGPILKSGDLDNPALARHLSPAVMSYHGIQYQSMAPEVMDSAQLAWLQDHLWILSGLYGCVRPFHAVEPYRLEMGAKACRRRCPRPLRILGDKLARAIAPAGSNTTIVNLASVEYAKAVLPHLRGRRRSRHMPLWRGHPQREAHPTVDRQQKARGSMVRWMAENKLEDASELTAFNIGYRHIPSFQTKNTLGFHERAGTIGPPFPNTRYSAKPSAFAISLVEPSW